MHEARIEPEVVFVLHQKQPLTTDPAAVLPWPGCAVVLVTAPGAPAAVREDVAAAPAATIVADPGDWGAAVQKAAAGRPFDVVTNDEYSLLACARLREELGLPRRHPARLERYLDKASTKRRLADSGLDVARWTRLDRVEADEGVARRLVETLGLPLVVKPRQEANSRGVDVLRDLGEVLRWQAAREGAHGWLVEEYVEGMQCHVNAVVQDGRLRPVQVGRYLGPLLGLSQGRRLGGVLLTPTDPLVERANALNERVVACLGDDGAFVVHTEFVVRPDGGLCVQEVAARAPGAMVSEAARVHTGLNLEEVNLALQLGVESGPLRPTGILAGWVWVPVMPGERFTAAPVFASGALVHVRAVARQGNAGRTGMIGASVLVWNADEAILAQDVQRAVAWDWTAAGGAGDR